MAKSRMGKIQFITAVAGRDYTYQSGEVVELPIERAQMFCECGLAEPVATAAPNRSRKATAKKPEKRG